MADEEVKKAKRVRRSVGPALLFWLIVLALAVVAGFSSIYVVDETENAVITRFGKYQQTVGSGLHVKLPFGIDKNYNVDIKTLRAEQFGFKTVKSGRNNEYKNNISEESEMLTGDLNIVDVEWVIQYKVTDPKQWLFNVYEREQTIRDISRSVINTLVGDRAIFDVISQDRSTIQNLAQALFQIRPVPEAEFMARFEPVPPGRVKALALLHRHVAPIPALLLEQ